MFRFCIGVNASKYSYNVFLRPNTIISAKWKSLSTSDNCGEDLVSPLHPISNLRLTQFSSFQNESNVEKEYRIKRIKLQEWNHNYWLNNNSDFQKKKAEFIEKELKGSNREQSFKPSISYDELALFYKRFLDENHRKHMNYNFEWYKRHTSLLFPALVVFISRMRRKWF